MEDVRKTKKQMIEELNELRQSVAELKGYAEEIQQTRVTSEKFTKAFLQNSIPMTITAAKEGKVVEVSDAFLRLAGLKRHEVVGHSLIESGFITKEQRVIFLNELNKSGRVDNYEMEVRPKGKGLKYGLFNIVMISFNNENCLLTSIQDITDRKQAQEELRESEERFRFLADNSTDVIWTMTLDGRFSYVSPSITNLSGFTPQEAIAIPFHKYVVEAYVEPIMTELASQLEKPASERLQSFSIEAQQYCKDGAIKDIDIVAGWLLDERGTPIGIQGSTRDITARKRIEDSLQESEERYKALFDRSLDCVYVHDFAGNFLDANDAALNLLGYKREELPSLNFATLLSDDQIPRSLQALQEILDNGFQKNIAGYRLKRKNGDYVHLETIASVILRDGKPYAIQGVARDINERKQAEAEKEKLEAQNRQLRKTESLGRMAGAIAHHFNNQLGAVIGNLEMVIAELPKGAAHLNRLTKAMQSAWKAADMSGLMLTYLGQSRDKREPLDLSYVCIRSLPLHRETLPGNVLLKTDFPDDSPFIMANSGEMQQILTNLITNAREAIGDSHGTISLSVKTVSPAEITAKHRHPIDWQPQDKPYACLEVNDNGCGIEDTDIEQLFDPFFTDKFTGRGMGLPVVLGIVKACKGVITVESKPGSGSAFCVFFPLSEEALRQPKKAVSENKFLINALSPGKMEEGGTVLVVEDEAMLRDMAEAMLESFGFTVLKAKDGVDALEVFAKHQSEIKFVLTDLTMPRMSGWETLTALRKLKPDIPVILASGYDLAHVMAGDHPELPQAFLAKPYNLTALQNAITKTMGRKKG